MKFQILFFIFAAALPAFAAVPTPIAVMAETNGALASPTNFIGSNIFAGTNVYLERVSNGRNLGGIRINAAGGGGGGDFSFTNLYQIASPVLSNLAANADQTVTNAQAGNAGISVVLSGGTLWITNNWSTNGFVDQRITNGLAALTFTESLTNGFVDQRITNGLAAITFAESLTNGFVDQRITNGLAAITFAESLTNGFVDQRITNGLAALTFAESLTNGFVDASITNGLAGKAYVDANFQPLNATLTQWGTVATNAYVSSTNGSARGLTVANATATRIAIYDANKVLTNSSALTAGQYLTFDGTGLVPSNLPPATVTISPITGTTNVLQLSVQAAKLPATNPVGFENGYQDWETIYYKTNGAGTIASLSGTWQFIVPPDYATNTLKVRIFSTLLTTNGPNSSNVIFRASILRATPGDATDLHVGTFGSTVSGTVTWAASGTVTNQVQSLVISMTTAALIGAGDLAILKLDRDAATDTFGGSTALVGLQLEYVRP